MLARMLLIAAVAAGPAVVAQSGESASWNQLVRRLEKAALDGSAAELRAIRAHLAQQAADPARDHGGVRYAIAYSAWRLAVLPGVPDNERKAILEDAVTQLQSAVKRKQRDAEAHALLGSVYGLQIAESPLVRGMTLGPRASGALDRAAEIDPENPRVLLQQGISAFNTPAMFGGGLGKAERLLRRSLERFASEQADKPWPYWGRFDAHVWLGQTLLQKGDREGARAEYDTAQALGPNSGWLKNVLMPALDRRN